MDIAHRGLRRAAGGSKRSTGTGAKAPGWLVVVDDDDDDDDDEDDDDDDEDEWGLISSTLMRTRIVKLWKWVTYC